MTAVSLVTAIQVVENLPYSRTITYIGQLIVSFLIAIIGEWNSLLQIFIVLIAIDFFTRITVAALEGKLQSKLAKRGALKKMLYIMVVVAFYQFGLFLEVPSMVRQGVLSIFVVSEFVSIIENVSFVDKQKGGYVPAPVVSFAEQLVAVAKEDRDPQDVLNDEGIPSAEELRSIADKMEQ